MGLDQAGKRDDVDEDLYQGVIIAVGTSQVEAKVGASREPARQLLVLYNDSNATIYYGPSGVTTSGSTKGLPLVPRQEVAIPIGNVALYMIAGSAANNVIVQEFG